MVESRVQLTPLTVDADPMLLAQYGALMTSNADRINLPPGEAARCPREHVQALGDPANRNIRFAIVSGDVVVGRLDMVPVEPPRYSLGYWIAREHTGQGHATRAVLLAAEHARGHLRATDLYAGVKKGNHASTRVLTRAGFRHVADQGTYDAHLNVASVLAFLRAGNYRWFVAGAVIGPLLGRGGWAWRHGRARWAVIAVAAFCLEPLFHLVLGAPIRVPAVWQGEALLGGLVAAAYITWQTFQAPHSPASRNRCGTAAVAAGMSSSRR